MTDFNVLTMNSKALPGHRAAGREARRARAHPPRQPRRDGSPPDPPPRPQVPSSPRPTAAASRRRASGRRRPCSCRSARTRDIEFVADAPGDWALHCHMTHHVMNQMGHELPNMIGVPTRTRSTPHVRALLPGYMTMGDTGMGEMADMRHAGPEEQHRRCSAPRARSRPSTWAACSRSSRCATTSTSYDDPGWYEHPAGTVASVADGGRARAPTASNPSGSAADAGTRNGSGLRDDGRSRDDAAPRDPRGRDYHFCGARCRERFLADPARFLTPRARRRRPRRRGREYTCPMHPEVVQRGPGACPICGMALEPRDVSLPATRPNPELDDMTRRLGVSAALTVPLFAARDVGPAARAAGPARVAAPRSRGSSSRSRRRSSLWGARPFFVRGWASLRTRRLNMFTLIALGTGVAYGYSVVATLVPGLFPIARRRTACRSTSRPRPSSRRSCCSARCSSSARASKTGGAIRALLGLAPEDRAPPRRRRQRGATSRSPTSTSATACACGPASACRSTASSLDGSERRRRVDGDRRADPGRERRRRHGHRRHDQRHRRLRHARRARRRATRCSRGSSGWSSEAQRSRAPIQRLADAVAELVRAGGARDRGAGLRRLDGSRTRAAPRARARRRGRRADHRLPVRARPRDADVDHGRRRPRRARPAC